MLTGTYRLNDNAMRGNVVLLQFRIYYY